MMRGKSPASVDEYIEQASEAAQPMLRELRRVIRENAPEAEEGIGYQMPAYRLHGPLVYFAAFKSHVSLFGAGATLTERFKKELEPYKTSKGTIQFPIGKPVPAALVAKMVKARVEENEAKATEKKRR